MKTHVYKLVLGFLLTSLFSVNSYSQEYEYIPMVKPGLQLWTCDEGYYGHDDEAYRFRRYALTDEDTIIENETYKKLYSFTNSEFDPTTATCIGGMRENAQKQVFYRVGETNKMIYDFSLSIGDTLYDSDYPDLIFQVEDIDTINYNGIQRREFTILTNGLMAAIWIEGIGNYEGIYYPFHTNTAENWGNTRCYIHNGDLLYSNYSHGGNNCIDPLMGVENISEDNSITLYPNPTSKDVNISSENIINSIEVFNSIGQRVYQTKVNSKSKSINISSLSKGVYIIVANTDKGYIRKKLIKN